MVKYIFKMQPVHTNITEMGINKQSFAYKSICWENLRIQGQSSRSHQNSMLWRHDSKLMHAATEVSLAQCINLVNLQVNECIPEM